MQALTINPYQLLVKADQLTLDGIMQFYVNVETEDHKFDALYEMYPFLNKVSGILFCNTRKGAHNLSQKMQTVGDGDSESEIREMVIF